MLGFNEKVENAGQQNYEGPTLGVLKSDTVQAAADQKQQEPAPWDEILEAEEQSDLTNDDPGSQQSIYEARINAELHSRAQHLMDYVREHNFTRAKILAALMSKV